MRSIHLATVAVLALAVPVGAEHCETYSTTPHEVATYTVEGAPVLYVDVDICQICDWISVWVYEESNGLDGLQRGDEAVDDTCHAMIRPDTIVF